MGIDKPHRRLLAWQRRMDLVMLFKAQTAVDECVALTYGLRKKLGGEH
jgi:hypothetical protein